MRDFVTNAVVHVSDYNNDSRLDVLVIDEERTLTFDAYDGHRDGLVEAHLDDELSLRHLRETY